MYSDDVSSKRYLKKDSVDTHKNLNALLRDFLNGSSAEKSKDIDADISVKESFGLEEKIRMIENSGKTSERYTNIINSYFTGSSISRRMLSETEIEFSESEDRQFVKELFQNCIILFSYKNTEASPIDVVRFIRNLIDPQVNTTSPMVIIPIVKKTHIGNNGMHYIDHEIVPLVPGESDWVPGSGYVHPDIGFSELLSKRLGGKLSSIDKRTRLQNMLITKMSDTPLVSHFSVDLPMNMYNVLYIPHKFYRSDFMGSKRKIYFNEKDRLTIYDIIRMNLPINTPSKSSHIDWYRNAAKKNFLMKNDKRSNISIKKFIRVANDASVFKGNSNDPAKNWAVFLKNNGRLPRPSTKDIDPENITKELIQSISSMYQLFVKINPEARDLLPGFRSTFSREIGSKKNADVYTGFTLAVGKFNESWNYFLKVATRLNNAIGSNTSIIKTMSIFIQAYQGDKEHYMMPNENRPKQKYIDVVFEYLVLKNWSVKNSYGNRSSEFGIISQDKHGGIKLALTYIGDNYRNIAISNDIGGYGIYREKDQHIEVLSTTYGIMRSNVDYTAIPAPGDINELGRNDFNTQSIVNILDSIRPGLGKLIVAIDLDENPLIPLALIGVLLTKQFGGGRYKVIGNQITKIFRDTFPAELCDQFVSIKSGSIMNFGAEHDTLSNIFKKSFIKHDITGLDIVYLGGNGADAVQTRTLLNDLVTNPLTSSIVVGLSANDASEMLSTNVTSKYDGGLYHSLMSLIGEKSGIAGSAYNSKELYVYLRNIVHIWPSSDPGLIAAMTSDGGSNVHTTDSIIKDLADFRKRSNKSKLVLITSVSGDLVFGANDIVREEKNIRKNLRQNLKDEKAGGPRSFWPATRPYPPIPGDWHPSGSEFGNYKNASDMMADAGSTKRFAVQGQQYSTNMSLVATRAILRTAITAFNAAFANNANNTIVTFNTVITTFNTANAAITTFNTANAAIAANNAVAAAIGAIRAFNTAIGAFNTAIGAFNTAIGANIANDTNTLLAIAISLILTDIVGVNADALNTAVRNADALNADANNIAVLNAAVRNAGDNIIRVHTGDAVNHDQHVTAFGLLSGYITAINRIENTTNTQKSIKKLALAVRIAELKTLAALATQSSLYDGMYVFQNMGKNADADYIARLKANRAAPVTYFANKAYLGNKRIGYINMSSPIGENKDSVYNVNTWYFVNSAGIGVSHDSADVETLDAATTFEHRYVDFVVGSSMYDKVYFDLTGLRTPRFTGHHFLTNSSNELITKLVGLDVTNTSDVTEVKGSPQQRMFPDLADRSNITRVIIPIHLSRSFIPKHISHKDALNTRVWENTPLSVYKWDGVNMTEKLLSNANNVIVESDMSNPDNGSYVIPASFSVNANESARPSSTISRIINRNPGITSTSLPIDDSVSQDKRPIRNDLGWRVFA